MLPVDETDIGSQHQAGSGLRHWIAHFPMGRRPIVPDNWLWSGAICAGYEAARDKAGLAGAVLPVGGSGSPATKRSAADLTWARMFGSWGNGTGHVRQGPPFSSK